MKIDRKVLESEVLVCDPCRAIEISCLRLIAVNC